MKKLANIAYLIAGIILILISACSQSDDQKANTITGSGSTFIAPLMSALIDPYYQQTGVRINYQATGSGAGIRQIQEGIVDFAASDQPLTPDELNASNLIQFPMATGGIVPIVNLDGLTPGAIILYGPTLAAIYGGEITNWNDSRIAALNPDINLPDRPIIAIHRSDGSGTTFSFTEYLAKVSDTFKSNTGIGATVSWPTGVGAKGNAGVAATVARTPGAIGYVEYAYAESNNLSWTRMVNHDGNIVEPNLENFQAAAQQADWEGSNHYYLFISDQLGANTWPISANTFILIPKTTSQPNQMITQINFFEWAYEQDAREIATTLDFVPIPQSVIDSIKQVWADDLRDKNGEIIWERRISFNEA